MDAGKLDRRITIRRATVAADAMNEPVETWADHLCIWAAKRDVSDRERLQAAEYGATITARFTIRWSASSSGIGPKDRISYGGREYDILGIKEIGRREHLEITAAARAE